MTYIELTNKEKRQAVNNWNRDNKQDLLVAKQPGSVRPMLPMIITGNFYLVCPDTGYKTDKIPKKIIDKFLNEH